MNSKPAKACSLDKCPTDNQVVNKVGSELKKGWSLLSQLYKWLSKPSGPDQDPDLGLKPSRLACAWPFEKDLYGGLSRTSTKRS